MGKVPSLTDEISNDLHGIINRFRFFNPRLGRELVPLESAGVSVLSNQRFSKLFRVHREEQDWVVKVIFRQKPADYTRALFKSQAKREYNSALEFQKIGLRTLVPVDYFVNFNLFSLVDSVFVCEYITGSAVGWEFWDDCERRAVFWGKFVQDCLVMLNAGMVSKDLHPGNVMWSGHEEDPLVWIDNDIKRFLPSAREREKAIIIKRLVRKKISLTAEEIGMIEAL